MHIICHFHSGSKLSLTPSGSIPTNACVHLYTYTCDIHYQAFIAIILLTKKNPTPVENLLYTVIVVFFVTARASRISTVYQIPMGFSGITGKYRIKGSTVALSSPESNSAAVGTLVASWDPKGINWMKVMMNLMN